MLTKAPILSKLIFITVLALLFLTLFDSNPWWKVVLYALPATALNVFLLGVLSPRGLPPYLSAALQGLAAALLAYLFGLTPWFRTTLGTLVGFALLFSLGELLLASRFSLSPSPDR